jgi:hypothetical protein
METVDNENLNADGASDYFQGTQFRLRVPETNELFKVTYDQETLGRLTKALKNVATEHGFGHVEPHFLLRTILGLGKENGVYIPGPIFRPRNSYPLSYDFSSQFLARDRNFVRSLLQVVFCQSFAARDVDTVSLEEAVVSVEFDYRVGKRKIEIHYLTGLHKDDRMCVIIEGYGKKKPNFFLFQHSMHWANTRLLATRHVVHSAGVD